MVGTRFRSRNNDRGDHHHSENPRIRQAQARTLDTLMAIPDEYGAVFVIDGDQAELAEAVREHARRQAVLAMALALGCTEAERDVLLMFAGFLPPGWREIDSDLLRLHAAINDRGLPAAQREDLREVVRSLVRLAESRTARPDAAEEEAA